MKISFVTANKIIVPVIVGLLITSGVLQAATRIGANIITNGSFQSTSSVATSYFLGKLGIGTSTPSQKLHIAGGLRLDGGFFDGTNSSGASGAVLQSTGTSTKWVTLAASSNSYASSSGFASTSATSTYAWNANYANTAGDAGTLNGNNSAFFQALATAINTGNIASQSVNFANSAISAINSDTVDGQHANSFQLASTSINTGNINTQAVSFASTSATSTYASTAGSANTANTITGQGSLATLNAINNTNWSGSVLSVGNGGTGTSSLGWTGLAYVNNGNWKQLATSSLALATSSFATSSISQWFNDAKYLALNALDQIVSTVAPGTAPLIVQSSTKVAQLNADLLDGFDSSAFGDATAANQTTILSRLGTAADPSATSTTLFALGKAIYDQVDGNMTYKDLDGDGYFGAYIGSTQIPRFGNDTNDADNRVFGADGDGDGQYPSSAIVNYNKSTIVASSSYKNLLDCDDSDPTAKDNCVSTTLPSGTQDGASSFTVTDGYANPNARAITVTHTMYSRTVTTSYVTWSATGWGNIASEYRYAINNLGELGLIFRTHNGTDYAAQIVIISANGTVQTTSGLRYGNVPDNLMLTLSRTNNFCFGLHFSSGSNYVEGFIGTTSKGALPLSIYTTNVRSITCDANNVYLGGYYSDNTKYILYIAKNGTLFYQNTLLPVTPSDMEVDNANNLYFTYNTGQNSLVKLNAAGALQWSVTNGSDINNSILNYDGSSTLYALDLTNHNLNTINQANGSIITSTSIPYLANTCSSLNVINMNYYDAMYVIDNTYFMKYGSCMLTGY